MSDQKTSESSTVLVWCTVKATQDDEGCRVRKRGHNGLAEIKFKKKEKEEGEAGTTDCHVK